jgi:hypothetical protein
MNTNPLHPSKFYPLPLGQIRPQGWLARQLRIQADGLSGHLDEFWPDVQESRWFGGDAEGWERAPYWLDGVIPLAFLLDDQALQAKVTRYVDYILTHQHEDGWLGPRAMAGTGGIGETSHYDLWAMFLALKMLMQYYDATGDARVITAVEKCLHGIDRHIDRAPLFNWAQFRWFEALIPIYWLYEHTEAPWLLDLGVKLHAQGFNWRAFFERWPMTEPTPKGRWSHMSHVVNNAMAVKAHGLWWRQSGDPQDRDAVYDMIAKLDRYHGMVTGVFTGDECIAGLDPTQGTELCAVVEYMYSLEILLSLLGDPAFGDRLESITFNALPATFSPDMWSHQYDQQVNQVMCSIREDHPWTTNGPESNIFGLAPNYGCCTANLSQGWPKFAAHLWMRDDAGLTAVAYAPSVAEVEIDGARVTAALETGYPFRETLNFRIHTDAPVTFPLLLRIPTWAKEATVQVADDKVIHAEAGTFHRIAREWRGTTEVVLTLPMAPRLLARPHRAVAMARGPLVYALTIGEDWRRVHEDLPYRELPHADWEIYPTTPWNYALALEEALMDATAKAVTTNEVTTNGEPVMFTEHAIGDYPFSPDGAPVSAQVKGRRVPAWQLENGSAGALPQSPVTSSKPLEALTLIPYGCTNLRITEFPVLRDED